MSRKLGFNIISDIKLDNHSFFAIVKYNSFICSDTDWWVDSLISEEFCLIYTPTKISDLITPNSPKISNVNLLFIVKFNHHPTNKKPHAHYSIGYSLTLDPLRF